MKNKRLFLALSVFVFVVISCSLFSGGGADVNEDTPSTGERAPGAEPQQDVSPPGASDKNDTEFPMPPKVENFTKLGDGAINFQTSMKLMDVIDFYRNEFKRAGYDERDITTSITDTTFSIVWDGHPSGKALVVQGVDLGNGTVNVNVRLE